MTATGTLVTMQESAVFDKPILFLDVDDVLNARRYPFAEHVLDVKTADMARNPFTNSFSGDTVSLTVCIPNVYSLWLSELEEEFELVWATTWEGLANTHISPLLGLGELEVVEFSQWEATLDEVRSGDPAAWKWARLVLYAKDRPFVFVDDRADSLARERPLESSQQAALWVEYGLERDHVEKLLAWSRDLSEARETL